MLKEAPIYEALINYIREKNLRLHMPGHVGGHGMDVKEMQRIAQFDLTEVPGLDDIHLSRGVIEKAREKLSNAYGAKESFFLVNGASSGIHTLFMSLFNDGDIVIIPRNAHKSFYAAMVLSGAIPVYSPCEINDELGITLSIKMDKLEELLQLYPDSRGVFICSPSYYGTCCDISQISSIAAQYGKKLFVDEAHGGHFIFHPDYPCTAMQSGATAAVNGLHKTLAVFNQGACIHVGDNFGDIEKLKAAFSLLTTTSPSYPILASIDLARAYMEQNGQNLLEKARVLSQEYKSKLDAIKGIRCVREGFYQLRGVKDFDPLKVLIYIDSLSINAAEMAEILRKKYKIQIEMNEHRLLLAMFSIFHQKEDWELFYQAVADIAVTYYTQDSACEQVEVPPIPGMLLRPRDAYMSLKKTIKLEESRGMIAGEMVAAYPPGIPCILPGEVISDEMIDYFKYLRKNEVQLHGPSDPFLNNITVLDV